MSKIAPCWTLDSGQILTVRSGELIIQVTDKHYSYPDQWAFACDHARMAWRPMGAETLEEAKKEAVERVIGRFKAYLNLAEDIQPGA